MEEGPEKVFNIAGQNYIKENFIKKGGFGKALKVKKIEDNKIVSEEENIKLYFKNFLMGTAELKEEYFVIKRSKISEYKNEKSLFRLKNEGDMMKEMNHPNIIKVLENEIQKGKKEYECIIHILMEYANSGSLIDEMNKYKTYSENSEDSENSENPPTNYYFPENRIWKILTQISLGLDYLHDQQIFHRDIKPGNFLVFDSEFIKITDFGISRVLGNLQTGELTYLAGTPQYLAPEAVDYKCSCISDIWSLGVTIFQLCTNSFPLGFVDKQPLIANLHYERPINISLLDKYSLSLQDLIKQMLKYQPEERISVKDILKHPKIACLIKPCIVRKKLMCNKNHKLKFIIPKRVEISSQYSENSSEMNVKCSVCSELIPCSDGYWKCNLCNYIFCSNENQMKEIKCYVLLDKEKNIIDVEKIPFEIRKFRADFEGNDDLLKLYKLLYMDSQLSLKSSLCLNLMVNFILNNEIQDKSVLYISENDVSLKSSQNIISESLRQAKHGCHILMKTIQKIIILCRIYINKFKHQDSFIFCITLLLKCIKHLNKLCLLNKDEKDINSIYPYYLLLIAKTIQTSQYDKLVKDVDESNIFRLKFEILFNELEMNKYLLNPIPNMNCVEDLQNIIQNKIFVLFQSNTENPELKVYKELFETSAFSYSSKEESTKHNYIFEYLKPRTLSSLQEFIRENLKVVLDNPNF